MTSNDNKGLRRLVNACRFSWQGLCATYQHEEAFRQEVWLLVVAVPLALWLGDNAIERVLLMGSVLLLLIVELFNSAIEAVVDRISLEKHELSGRAKDMGSAAVLLTSILVLLVWGFIVF